MGAEEDAAARAKLDAWNAAMKAKRGGTANSSATTRALDAVERTVTPDRPVPILNRTTTKPVIDVRTTWRGTPYAPEAGLGVSFQPKQEKLPTQEAEGKAAMDAAKEADEKARAAAEQDAAGPRLVGMTRAQMLPDTKSLKVSGANPAGPEELSALSDYFAGRRKIGALKAEGDPRQKAMGELQQAIAQHQLRGVDQENAIREDDERVLGQLREKAQKAWDNAEKDLEPQFGKTIVMALIAAFGGQYGAQIVSSLIDADVREKELAYSGKRDKARGAEDDLKGFAGLSKDAGTRREEMRLQRLMAVSKIGEAHIARMPNNDAKIQALEVQSEIDAKVATTLRDLYARQRGNVTLEKSDKFAPAKGIYAGGGGKKKDVKPPPSAVAKLKEEQQKAGLEWTNGKANLGSKFAALQNVLDIANEGVSPSDQYFMNQVMSSPSLFNRIQESVWSSATPAKRARMKQAVLAATKEMHGARSTEFDALKSQLATDFSAEAEAFKGQIQMFNSQANDLVSTFGDGARVFLSEKLKAKTNYAPMISPPGEKAKGLAAP